MNGQSKQAGLLITMIILVISFTSCDQEYFFYDAVDIENAEWRFEESPQFEFSTSDTSSYLDFYLDIRNNEVYSYRNIYAFIEMEFPNEKTLKDTIHFPDMATPEGKWTGSGIGGSYDNSILYKSRRKLPLPGDYKLRVTHAMRDEALLGIERVGIHIESHSER